MKHFFSGFGTSKTLVSRATFNWSPECSLLHQTGGPTPYYDVSFVLYLTPLMVFQIDVSRNL